MQISSPVITNRCLLLLIFFSIWVCSNFSVFGQDVLLEELKKTIESTSEFDQVKNAEIIKLSKKLQKAEPDNLPNRYKLSRELFQEYKLFNQDSAYSYGKKTHDLAVKLDSLPLINTAVIDIAEVTVSAGMYKESLDLLEKIDPEKISPNQRSLYYGLLGRIYSEMAEYSSLQYYSSRYNELAARYRKKALHFTEEGTFFHSFLQAFTHYHEGRIDLSLREFHELLQRDLTPREEALVHYLLGDIYDKTNRDRLAISHFAHAAVRDVKTSTKETLAIIRLSEILFQRDDLKNASFFIQKANRDAAFYGAQHRKIQVGAILPLIEEKVITRIEEQRQRLYRQNILMGLLLLFVLSLAVVIYLQVRRLQAAKKDILETHENLQLVNTELNRVNEEIQLKNVELSQVNNKLLEANKIKEEYIGFFFTQDADIFEQFRNFKSKIEKDLKADKIDTVKYTLQKFDLKREKEKLLKNFDEAFIKLFPNFIKEFNSLLKPEEQITLKKGQLLNKELRIFALMRLGINHNEVIAQILGYSVNSIYAYKTKIRKKSVLNKQNFDQQLIENTTLKL